MDKKERPDQAAYWFAPFQSQPYQNIPYTRTGKAEKGKHRIGNLVRLMPCEQLKKAYVRYAHQKAEYYKRNHFPDKHVKWESRKRDPMQHLRRKVKQVIEGRHAMVVGCMHKKRVLLTGVPRSQGNAVILTPKHEDHTHKGAVAVCDAYTVWEESAWQNRWDRSSWTDLWNNLRDPEERKHMLQELFEDSTHILSTTVRTTTLDRVKDGKTIFGDFHKKVLTLKDLLEMIDTLEVDFIRRYPEGLGSEDFPTNWFEEIYFERAHLEEGITKHNEDQQLGVTEEALNRVYEHLLHGGKLVYDYDSVGEGSIEIKAADARSLLPVIEDPLYEVSRAQEIALPSSAYWIRKKLDLYKLIYLPKLWARLAAGKTDTLSLSAEDVEEVPIEGSSKKKWIIRIDTTEKDIYRIYSQCERYLEAWRPIDHIAMPILTETKATLDAIISRQVELYEKPVLERAGFKSIKLAADSKNNRNGRYYSRLVIATKG